MDRSVTSVEEVLARLARRSHGVVTRTELLDAGVSATELRNRVRRGTLIRVHRGTYRVGHAAPSVLARYTAAVKACGPGSLLAGRAAAHLLGLLRVAPPQPEVLATARRRIPGVLAHRGRDHALDAHSWRGIPVTSVPRTLVDLSAVLSEEHLGRAVHEAAVRHRTTPAQVERVLSRRGNWPGARILRGLIWGDARITLSRLESLFLRRVHEAGLPLPVTNRQAGDRYVDCRWPGHALTVELDSYTYHHTRHAWERDRQREREARARGDEFRRYTWHDVHDHPGPMLADLASLLSRGHKGAHTTP